MKNYSFLTILFVLTALSLHGQKNVVKISKPIDFTYKKVFQKHVYSDPAGFHYVYYKEEEGGKLFNDNPQITNIIIARYDAKFNLEYEKACPIDGKKYTLLDIRDFNGKVVLLLRKLNKKNDDDKYVIMPIGLDGNPLPEIEAGPTIAGEKMFSSSVLQWDLSQDSSKLSVIQIKDDNDKKEQTGVNLIVINKDLSVQYTKKVQLGYTEKQVYIEETMVANDGSVYVLAKVDQVDKKSDNDTPSSTQMLFQIVQDKNVAKAIPLNLGASHIFKATLMSDAAGNIYCTGFYSQSSMGNFEGIFFFKVSKEGTVLSGKSDPFSEEQGEKLGKSNFKKGLGHDKGLLAAFDFTELILNPDGTFYFVAEDTYTQSKGQSALSMENPIGIKENVHHISDDEKMFISEDIIIFKLSNEGEITRISKISKQIINAVPNVTAHYACPGDGGLIFIYNEYVSNMDKPFDYDYDKIGSLPKKTHTVITKMDKDGTFSKRQVFDEKMEDDLISPQKCYQISGHEIFIITEKFKGLRGATVKIGVLSF